MPPSISLTHLPHVGAKTLRSKIFLRFTLLVGFTLVATGICSTLIARAAIEERASFELLSSADEHAKTILSTIDTRRTLTRVMAGDSRVIRFGQEPASVLRLHLLAQKEIAPDVQGAMILDRKGRVRVATDSGREGEGLADLSAFTYGLQGTHIGEWKVGGGQRTHTISSPIRSAEGDVLGVLIVEFDLMKTYRLFVEEGAIVGSAQTLFVEPALSGSFCFNPRDIVFSARSAIPAPLSKNGSLLEALQAGGSRLFPFSGVTSSLCEIAATGREGILSGTDTDGRASIAAHRFLPEGGLGVIVKLSAREVFSPVRILFSVLVGATIASLLVVTFIALRLSRDVVKPILSLQKGLAGLDTGHWIHKRSVFTDDELETLDKEVNRLALRLDEAYSSLEKRVQERTRELAEDHAKDEALLESIGEGVIGVDMNGKIVTCNRAAEQMLLWDREQMIGSHFSSCLVLRSGEKKLVAPREHFVQVSLERKASIRSTPHRTHTCERKDGTSFPIAIMATPFLLGMEMRGVVVTFQDISEEKRIDRMKSEFVSLASHQLRTPLTAIGWYIELLEKEAAPLFSQDQKDYITQIVASHQRMVALVNDLLNVSRIELGRLTIEPEHVNLRILVDEIVNELLPLMQEKKLQFKQRLPDRLQVHVDPRLVQMVLENLLSNAIKYTPVGGSVELAMILAPQEVHFEIRDTGYGIPTAQQNRIFEKLFRADNIVKTDTVGTGIGLYIARSATEAWGGRLWFESEEGHGTTFYFTVPLDMQKMGEEGTVTAPPPTGGTGADSSSPH